PRGWFTPAVLIMAYGLIIFGSIFYAADFSSAQAAADDYWKDGLITVLVASLIQNKRIFRYVIWALICSGIFMGTLSVYQYLTGSFSNEFYGFAQAPLLNIVGDTQGNRVAGPIGDPNFYAQIMVVLVPFAINRMANEKSIYLKLLAGFGVIVISLSVILTYSRGGFFALVIALIALGFYRPPRLPLFLSLMAVVWIVVLFLPTTFVDRISTVTGLIQNKQDIQVESSFRGRASEMITAWLMFVDHPVLGVGSHNYPVYYQQYSRQLGLDPRTTAREPHNLYLEIAAETGILGILVFGIIVYFAFRYINFALVRFKESKDKDFYSLIGAYSAGFIGYLTAAMFIHGAYPRYFWLLAGIAYSLKHIAKKEINHQYMKD
ncbi:MAG TPA: O-antigen ligase family protein, partial [Leptolinea sp.]